MYDGREEIVAGYTKSLWSAFGPTALAVGAVGVMGLAFVAPPLFALLGPDRATRAWGALGYASGVAGRWLVAHRTGERTWPDVLAQPLSLGAFGTLTLLSVKRHRAGTLTWHGRPIP